MRRMVEFFSGFFLVVCLSGCYTTGLSNREKGEVNYSNFVYGLYSTSSGSGSVTRSSVSKPIKLAVAQIGENTAPAEVLERFRKESDLIAEAVSIPAAGAVQKQNKTEYLNNQVDLMCRLAQDMGVDYLYVFGGNIDYTSKSNPLVVFDLTIIGAFIFPGVNHYAEGNVSGALIDLSNRRVVFINEASDTIHKKTPSYLDSYGEGSRDLIITTLRKRLFAAIAEGMIKKLAGL